MSWTRPLATGVPTISGRFFSDRINTIANHELGKKKKKILETSSFVSHGQGEGRVSDDIVVQVSTSLPSRVPLASSN